MPEARRLESIDEVDALIAASHGAPVVLFKHSLICPVSTAAYDEYRRFLDERPAGEATVYALVEIQKARPVSQAIARRTGVRHESPQALLLRHGEVVWHASHWDIRRESLREALAAL